MDSVTQAALGAAVAVAVVGKHSSIKKAAIWGAVIGTLPDLDVFIDYGDDLSEMVRHRGESHSLVYQTLIAPLLAWLICRWHQQQQHFKAWWLAVWLVLVTHSLLDTFTTYGTQLLLPFSNYPFALESIFVIDPMYTLPLLAGLVYAWRQPEKGLAANRIGLICSSGYLLWSLLAQQWVIHQVTQQGSDGSQSPYRLLVQPTALNTLVWRIIKVDEHGYQEGFYALSDGRRAVTFRQHYFPEQTEQLRAFTDAERLTRFSHGFVGYFQRDALFTMADLRMGMQGNYAFEFTLACQQHDGVKSTHLQQTRKSYQMVEMWLWAAQRFLQQETDLTEAKLRSENPCNTNFGR